MSSALTVLFSGRDFEFLSPVIELFRADPRGRVLIDAHSTHQMTDVGRAAALAEEASVIFSNWSPGDSECGLEVRPEGPP